MRGPSSARSRRHYSARLTRWPAAMAPLRKQPTTGGSSYRCGSRSNNTFSVLPDQLKSAPPTRLGEEVQSHVEDVIGMDVAVRQCLARRVVRPEDQQRLADNIFARDESPIAAVE